MNAALLHPEVQEFIRKNLNTDVQQLVLKGSPFPKVSAAEIATQISALKTAEKKLPTWFKTENILFPPKLNLEQTSSEITAAYKATLISGKKITDLTGGFGIDTTAFAENFKEVYYCELNEELAEIAAHNFRVLGKNNIRVLSGDGIAFLKNSTEHYDAVYLDPSRRDKHGGKVFRMADCLPDVPRNLDLIFSKTDKILVKTSPLIDLKLGVDELAHTAEIHIVAVNNEVKELLWLLKKDFKGIPKIICTDLQNPEKFKLTALFESAAEVNYSLPQSYLYEPNAAIMKSGLFEVLAEKTGTKKLHPFSHLYTSEELKEFPGRIFKITDFKLFKSSELKKKFKGKKANITTRNFPETVAQLRKKFKIKDGGDTYLFFTTGPNEEKLIITCEKV